MCTDFVVKLDATRVVNGRSMDFALDLRSKLFFRCAGHRYDQRPSGPQFGYTWIGKYDFVGMNVDDLPVAVDGINSEGLATGALWLPGSEYQKISHPDKGLSIDYFVNWLLSSFSSCKEVRAALHRKKVQVGFPKLLSHLLPLHFPVHDATGNSIVIEFINSEVQVHDNPVGVLTNDPPFPWHLQNLRNYVGISPWDKEPTRFGDLRVEQTGHGSGFAHYVPGDSTPPSRFVRAAMMTQYAYSVTDLDQATNLAFHILNTVDIPRGTSRFGSEHDREKGDYPQWATTKDLHRKIYAVRLYGSPQVYSVDLSKIDFKAVDGKQMSIPTGLDLIDLSGKVSGQSV